MALETQAKYSGVSMAVHWLIALGVLLNWWLHELAEEAATKAEKSAYMGPHFSIGILLFVLTVFYLIWRRRHPGPPLGAHFASWERVLAKTTHFVFFALLIVMPLAGWLAMSKYGSPISFFGIFSLPPLPVATDPEAGKAIFEKHGIAGKVLLYLVGLHVLGTLKHTLLDKDGNLFRMLPFGTAKD